MIVVYVSAKYCFSLFFSFFKGPLRMSQKQKSFLHLLFFYMFGGLYIQLSKCVIQIMSLTLQPQWYLTEIFTHLQLCVASATHNFMWLKIPHICSTWHLNFAILAN